MADKKKIRVEWEDVECDQVELNHGQIQGVPKKPRVISKKNFEKLGKSMEETPEMSLLRPPILYSYRGKLVAIGGNQRAAVHIENGDLTMKGMVIKSKLTAKKIREIALKDNSAYGKDDVVLLDDDCRGIYRWQDQEKWKVEKDQLEEICEGLAILCKDAGFKFWWINCIPDKAAYREHTPFGFVQYIGGPFQAHMKDSELRYDENLPLKEDYDMTLQHIHKYGGCLRANFMFYDVKQAEQEGGCADYRTLSREKEQFELLQKKWGTDIVRRDKGSKRSFDFNPVIKSPIKGV